jgi:hypothetical protein
MLSPSVRVSIGRGARQMGWVMLFWVSVIVGVPTVLWFLLPEEEPGSGDPDREDYKHNVEHPRTIGKRMS